MGVSYGRGTPVFDTFWTYTFSRGRKAFFHSTNSVNLCSKIDCFEENCYICWMFWFNGKMFFDLENLWTNERPLVLRRPLPSEEGTTSKRLRTFT